MIFAIPAIAPGPGPVPDPAVDRFVAIFGIVMAGFGAFMTFGCIAVARTRITLGPDGIDASVPDHTIFLLLPHFRRIVLPLSDISAVVRRHEIFRYLGLPNLRESLWIVTAQGERIGLFSNTEGPSIDFPIDDVAAAIAAATGHAVTDGGTVLTNAPGLYGQASSSWDEIPLSEDRAAKARRAAARTAQIVVGLISLTLILRACL